VHLQPDGMWSANVTVFGAWTAGIGYTLDWLTSVPATFAPRCRRIERGAPWFTLVDLELSVSERRPVPLSLHVAAVSGTLWVPTLEEELLSRADAVIFHAEVSPSIPPQVTDARSRLDGWLEERGDAALLVFQLDHSSVVRPPETDGEEVLSIATLRDQLAIGRHPYVETNARVGDVAPLFRIVVDRLLAARETLPRRPAYV